MFDHSICELMHDLSGFEIITYKDPEVMQDSESRPNFLELDIPHFCEAVERHFVDQGLTDWIREVFCTEHGEIEQVIPSENIFGYKFSYYLAPRLGSGGGVEPHLRFRAYQGHADAEAWYQFMRAFETWLGLSNPLRQYLMEEEAFPNYGLMAPLYNGILKLASVNGAAFIDNTLTLDIPEGIVFLVDVGEINDNSGLVVNWSVVWQSCHAAEGTLGYDDLPSGIRTGSSLRCSYQLQFMPLMASSFELQDNVVEDPEVYIDQPTSYFNQDRLDERTMIAVRQLDRFLEHDYRSMDMGGEFVDDDDHGYRFNGIQAISLPYHRPIDCDTCTEREGSDIPSSTIRERIMALA